MNRRSTSRRQRTTVKLLFAVTLSIVLSAAATPALAEPMEQGTFEQHFNFVREGFCGDMDISIEGDDRGSSVARDAGPSRLPRFTSTHHGGATWTNLASGLAFTFEWHYASQDVSVTDNGDGTLSVVYQVSGPERIYGPDGQELVFFTGMMRVEAVIDHAGTPTEPSDDIFLYEDFLAGNGFPELHPPIDFCESFRALTGS
jgi:hypothetical protein